MRIVTLIFAAGFTLVNGAVVLRQNVALGPVAAIPAAIPKDSIADILGSPTPDPQIVWEHDSDVRAHAVANYTGAAWEFVILTIGGIAWFSVPLLRKS